MAYGPDAKASVRRKIAEVCSAHIAETGLENVSARPVAKGMRKTVGWLYTMYDNFGEEDLDAQIAAFIEHYNHRRYHESLDNLTPADVHFGRGETILLERERIKRDTIRQRRLNHQAKTA